MSNDTEKESPLLPFRIYPDPNGKVLLIYEPLKQQVELSAPIDEENLENAGKLLLAKCGEVLAQQEKEQVGKDEATANPQQRARRLVQQIKDPPRPRFWAYARRKFEHFNKSLREFAAAVVIIALFYKGVELSQDNLPEFLHWIVIVAYLAGLSVCIDLMATDEHRRKATAQIRFWFGPSGMLLLPSLTLVAAAAVFSSITLSLYRHGLVILQECDSGRQVTAGALTDFYMWHFMKLVPLVKINEVLKLGEPLCYTQKRVGLLILIFQALVVLPSINTVLYYWKNRSRLTARSYDFVYDPEWEPREKETD